MPMIPSLHPALARAEAFCARYGLRIPILLAPMAGACPPALSIAVAKAGGLGAGGALLMNPTAIAAWTAEVRRGTNGPFQLNLWSPTPRLGAIRRMKPPCAPSSPDGDQRCHPRLGT
jgi:NAD(P)H-dependent flavin oxidoreductase YrpB (nitropropane dioxygenase family)